MNYATQPVFDVWYLVLALPGLVLGLWAQSTLRGTFGKYSKVPTESGVTGVDAARELIQGLGLQIGVKNTPGQAHRFLQSRRQDHQSFGEFGL